MFTARYDLNLLGNNLSLNAELCLRRLFAGNSLWKAGFYPRLDHAKFFVNRLALEELSVQVLLVSSSPYLSTDTPC